jgi:hypothetical protein
LVECIREELLAHCFRSSDEASASLCVAIQSAYFASGLFNVEIELDFVLGFRERLCVRESGDDHTAIFFEGTDEVGSRSRVWDALNTRMSVRFEILITAHPKAFQYL